MIVLRNFFWFCSGAHQNLLQRCPTEANKYAGIGATIFFTGLFAALSGGYALYTVFDTVSSAVIFGMLWGTMIFNLDRYIVSSMSKQNRFWPEFKMALPRFVLAVLLALVISKPLELKIFEKEINRQLDVRKNEQTIQAKAALQQSFPEITEVEAKILALKEEVAAKAAYRNQKQEEYDLERFGAKTPGTSGIVGLGTNARKKEQQLNDAEQDLRQTEARVQQKTDAYEREITQLREARGKAFENQQPTIAQYDGLAARMDALQVLTTESKAMELANLFLILLFIAIEIAPILVKLIAAKGPYDELLAAREHGFSVYTREQTLKLDQQSEKRLQLFMDAEKNQVEEKLFRDQYVRNELGKAEKELFEETIRRWKEEEMEKLNRESMRW